MPRGKQKLADEQTIRPRTAQRSLDDAQAELREVVGDLLNEGESIREVAAAAEISTNTVQKWKRAEQASGLPRHWSDLGCCSN
ncbi:MULTISPECIES: helix-turn-helix domain-containing protein [unclassified Rathayibacter]|uniref:helix-turn-helix domain-containing protein n=1 Tax=unclassified Rathayibacter TaxID=2609250 RepID=UPI000F4CA069|nr:MULTISPECIES: helix-turn-helix domain-containing protein [unclassified Rathayibacter]MCJ1705641.1 helix-turn-helix domain-containing protein [Rathayibacter sp. VKM Ac-2926]